MAPATTRRVENVSTEELYSVMQGLASQDPRIISTSEKRFKEMLDMFGTFDGLNAIATSKNLPLPIRQQSIIQFKNAALNHWRTRRLLSDEQRIVIRARSLKLLDEEDQTIASCNKVIIGKLARQDYPNAWPSLLPDLVATVNSRTQEVISSEGASPGAVTILQRSLEVLNAVLKELVQMKMPGGIKVMGKIVQDTHLFFQEHYRALSANLSSLITPSKLLSKYGSDLVQLSHLSYKCLSKVGCWLWQRLALHKNDLGSLIPWMNGIFDASVSQLETIFELRLQAVDAISSIEKGPIALRFIEFLTKHLRHIGKFFRRIQQLSMNDFIQHPRCNELVLFGWTKVVQSTEAPPTEISDSVMAKFPVRFLAQCMTLFKENLPQWSPAKRGAESGSALSREFVEGAVRILVSRFIPLKEDDLEKWSSDPEEWVNSEEKDSDQWEFELRPCAERVLLTLANQYQEYVTPLLASTFSEIVGTPTVDLESILQKEAIYCAVGRCAIRLKNVVPFELWVTQKLASEVQDNNASFVILKRRIAWVIGRWVSEDCFTPNNPLIWQALVHLLSDRGSGSDAAVRFTAVTVIKECIDVLTFEPNVFLPHLENAVWQIMRLASEAETLEAKRRVMECLNVVIERMGNTIAPHTEVIAKPIPDLWTSAGGDYLFKASLLVTVTKLIEAVKEASASLNFITIPLIGESLTGQASLHCDQDGLNLWQAALRNAPFITVPPGVPSLYDLVPTAIPLLANNLDLLGTVTDIIQSYIVLDCPRLLQDHAVLLFQAFKNSIGQAGMVNVKDLVVTLQLLVQTAPSTLWAEPMHISGLFSYLLKTVGEDKVSVPVLTEHVLFFARMAICDSTALIQLIAASANEQGKPESMLWKDMLDQWWQRFDNMSDPRHKKTAAMGIADLVATGRPEVLDRLDGEILNLWSDVFYEMKEALVRNSETEADSTLSTLVTFWNEDTTNLPEWISELEGSPEFARYQEIFKRDPVEREKLTLYVGARFRHAQQQYGGEQAFRQRWLAKADVDVVKQFYQEMSS